MIKNFVFFNDYQKRSGQGTFETINDGVIETVWENNVKDGPGVVICANNTVVTSECLFYKDKQASLNSEDEATELWLKEHTAENKQSLSNYNGEVRIQIINFSVKYTIKILFV